MITRSIVKSKGDSVKSIAMVVVLIISGCASTGQQEAFQRAQDAKYNRCVDKIHAMQKDGERVVWRLEVDACMGSRGDEYQTYQAQKQTKLPTRAEWEAK